MNEDFKADLHCHSSCSDGSMSPIELIQFAHSKGFKGLSITDHDTIEAYKPASIAVAQELGIKLGTGVEFSCDYQGTSLHILAYDYSLKTKAIHDLCDRHIKRRQQRNEGILNLLNKHQMFIEMEELASVQSEPKGILGRPHIALLMVEKGYAFSIKDAFQRFLGEGKKCYVKGASFSIEETSEVIHEAGGKMFVAHPHLIPKHVSIKELLKLPFDGIECYYSRFPRNYAEKWIAVCTKKELLVCGGSDFHGDLKPENSLGSSYVNKQLFDAIFLNPLS
jgi:predicted metal-dependent phosphoesterase TrpH